jgi:hypothetical protein
MSADIEKLKLALFPIIEQIMFEIEERRARIQHRPPERRPLLKASHVARELGIHLKEVYRKAASGELPKVPNLNRMIRFDPEVIDEIKREGLKAQGGEG